MYFECLVTACLLYYIYIEGNSEDRLTWDVKYEDLVEEDERHEGEERSQ